MATRLCACPPAPPARCWVAASFLGTEHLCLSASPRIPSTAVALLLLQGVPLEETRQHVASIVKGLQGRPGRRYDELVSQQQQQP